MLEKQSKMLVSLLDQQVTEAKKAVERSQSQQHVLMQGKPIDAVTDLIQESV